MAGSRRVRLMRVHGGDSAAALRWTSDRPVLLRLHGYDIEKRVAADGVTELGFTAYATRRIPIENHGAGAHEAAPLAIIEVYQR